VAIRTGPSPDDGLALAKKSWHAAVHDSVREIAMIVHRRTWFYRLAGQNFAQTISFRLPVTAQKVRQALQQKFGSKPLELWSH
jgi:hypothetical protein